jgi:tetratricopeptide (TPR) repeat protein
MPEWLLTTLATLRGERPLWRRHSHRHRRTPARRDPLVSVARESIGIGRLAAAGAVALIVLWMTLRIVMNTGAALLAASNPATALHLDSTSASALDHFAARQIAAEDGDLDRAEQALHQALRVSPLDQQVLLLLAEIARRRSEVADADELLRMAGRRSWRNLTAQLALTERDIAARRFGPALEHIDAALRLAPDLQYHDNHLLGVLAAYVLDSDALSSLQRFLGSAPPWREWFFNELCKRLVDPQPLDALFSSMATSANPPTHEERLAYIGRLIRDQRYEEARRQWIAELPGGAPPPTYPYNRDFKSAPDGSPFDWQVLARRGAEVRLRPAEGRNAGELAAQFSGTRVDMTVGELMLLPPGRYVFGGEVRARDLRASRGLHWRLFCADPAGGDLGSTDLVAADMPWTRFAIHFDVPREGCSAQRLQLEIPARVPSEREIEGQVWYRALAIEPIDPRNGPQLLWRWPN